MAGAPHGNSYVKSMPHHIITTIQIAFIITFCIAIICRYNYNTHMEIIFLSFLFLHRNVKWQGGRRVGIASPFRAYTRTRYRWRLNDCSMKHYIVLNIALFSHAHVTISAEINLAHACSRGEASRSNCHSRLRAFVGMASWNWETVLKV